MVENLFKSWWVFVVQGILAIGIGVAAFAVPGATLAAFIAVFAAYALITGILAVVAGLQVPNGPNWSLVLGGIAGIAVGVFTVINPNNTALALVLLVGIYAIATGVAQVVAAYQMGRFTNSFLLGLSGVLSVLFGVLLIAAPNDGVLAVLWLIGIYSVIAGIVYISIGLRIRSAGQDLSAFQDKVRAAGTPSSPSSSSSSSSSTENTSAGNTASSS